MKHPTWRRSGVGMLAAAAALACQAQPVVVPRPALPPEPAAPARPLDLKTPARPALPTREGLSVRVERFTVSGNSQLTTDELAAVLAPFEQRTLGVAELNAATDAVTTLYRRRGWPLALAYLPEQQIRDGVVEIAVLEGRLGALAIGESPAGTHRAFAAAVAQWGIEAGGVVGEANLVRNLLVLNEWPGVAVGADLRPGTQVGTADAQVDLLSTGPTYSGTAGIDNFGSKATGRVRAGASLTAREWLGRGDQFSAQALAGTDGGLRSLGAAYGLMVHPSGTRLTASASHLEYKLVDPAFASLGANGRATYLQFSVDQPWLRRVGHAVTLRAGVTGKRLRDRVDSFDQHEDRHIESLQIGAYGDHGERSGLGATATATTRWSATLTSGRVGFDDATAARADAVLRQTAGRYARFNLDASREQPLTPWLSEAFSVIGRIAWQQALHRNLDSAERATLGGASGPRPYGDLSVQADSAVQASVEVRWRTTIAGLPAAASAFVDRGVGRIDQQPAAGADNGVRSLLAGLGAEIALPADTTLRVALTRQTAQPTPAGSRPWASRGWLELVKAF